MGIRVARNFTASGFEDVFELSTEFSMAEFRSDDGGKVFQRLAP